MIRDFDFLKHLMFALNALKNTEKMFRIYQLKKCFLLCYF